MPPTLLALLLIPLLITIGMVVPCRSETAVATPASEVSQEVVARMRPEVGQAMQEKGFSLGLPIFIRIFKESDELAIHFFFFITRPRCRFFWGGGGG